MNAALVIAKKLKATIKKLEMMVATGLRNARKYILKLIDCETRLASIEIPVSTKFAPVQLSLLDAIEQIQNTRQTVKINLCGLLEKIVNGDIKVLNYQYKDAEYSVQFKSKTVFFENYWISSMSYKEWDETFYLNARNEKDLEFFKCTDGRMMEVEVR